MSDCEAIPWEDFYLEPSDPGRLILTDEPEVALHCGRPESSYLKNAVSQFHRPRAVGELTVASSIDQSSRPVFLTIQIRVYSRIPTKTVIRARIIEMMAIPSGANESGLSKLDTTLGGGGIADTSPAAPV
jgi:hypothetical protein